VLTGIAYAVVAGAAVAAVVIPAVAGAILPLSADRGLYITIGEILKHGGAVGRDAWDVKPPGVYYLYAAVLAFAPDYSQVCTIPTLLQAPSQHQLPCAQLVLSAFDAVYALALVASIWWLGWRLFGRAAGALAGLLCAIYSSMLQITDGGGLADIYVLLPGTLAYAAAFQYARTNQHRWLLFAGVMGGVAALFKQTGLILLAGIGVWLVVRGCRARRAERVSAWRASGLLAAGACGVLVSIGVLLGLQGVLGDVVDQAFLFGFSYVGHPSNNVGFIPQFVSQTWVVFSGSQSGLWLAGLVGLGMLVRGARDHWGVPLLTAWTVASLATVLAGGSQLHVNYYLAMVPPLSIAGGYALAEIWRTHGLAMRALLVVVGATMLVSSSRLQEHEYGNALFSRIDSNTHSTEEFVAGAIGAGPGSMFVWGNGPQVYALSGRPPASRYLHTIAVSYDYAVHGELEQNRAELMATLQTAPPQVIAIDTPWLRKANTLDFPELRALIEQDYVLSNSPANPIFAGWEIYRLRPASGG
jgi:hypothetical protein